MISKLLMIFLALTIIAVPLLTDEVHASCAAEVNYDLILKDSELVFTGTVDRLENYDGPQRVTFIIHDILKGEINTQKYILENSGKIFLENGLVRSSSNSVDYQISKTYKVFVVNGDTTSCTTKEIYQTDYIWEPGPESGKYYSENPVWVNPCDEGYGSYDGVCITLEEMNRGNPICSANPRDNLFGKCNKNNEKPDNTLEYVLAYCNATGPVTDDERRWWNATHYIDNTDCEFLDRDNYKSDYPPPGHLEPKLDSKDVPYPEPDIRQPENRLIQLTITLDQETYKTGDTIKLSANVGVKESDSYATVTLFKPNGIVVTSIQIMPNDEGIVSYHFKAGSGNMNVSGPYAFEITYEYVLISDHDIQTEYHTQSIMKQFSFNVIEYRTAIPISVYNDPSFFGIFVYLDNLISWIFGK